MNGRWGFGSLFNALNNIIKSVVKGVQKVLTATPKNFVKAVVHVLNFIGGGGSSKPKSKSHKAITSAHPSSPVKKTSFNTGLDMFELKNPKVRTFGNPSGPSAGFSGSYCAIVCLGGGMNSAGRPTFIFGVGPELGFNAGVNLSPDAPNKGWGVGVECSAFHVSAEVGTVGISGSLNVLPAKVGCGVKGSYTW